MNKELEQMKMISSANIIKLGKYKLDKDVLTAVNDRVKKKQKIEREKLQKEKENYLKICAAADSVLRKDKKLWTCKDYQTALKPLKTKGDVKMPSKLDELEQKWLEWSYRARKVIIVPEENSADNDSADKDEHDASTIQV